MDSIDPQMAERVWRRVRGTAPAGPDMQSLEELIAQEWADGAVYQHLSRKFQGKESALLRQLAQQEQAHVACLKGIYTLMLGAKPNVHTPPVPQASPEQLLRRCYNRELQSLAQYEARASDPQYGQTFAHLARQEREHSRIVLELLGKLKTP